MVLQAGAWRSSALHILKTPTPALCSSTAASWTSHHLSQHSIECSLSMVQSCVLRVGLPAHLCARPSECLEEGFQLQGLGRRSARPEGTFMCLRHYVWHIAASSCMHAAASSCVHGVHAKHSVGALPLLRAGGPSRSHGSCVMMCMQGDEIGGVWRFSDATDSDPLGMVGHCGQQVGFEIEAGPIMLRWPNHAAVAQSCCSGPIMLQWPLRMRSQPSHSRNRG